MKRAIFILLFFIGGVSFAEEDEVRIIKSPTYSTGWTKTGTNVHLTTSTDSVGVGTTTPDNPLELLSTTTPQVRIANTDATDYATFSVDTDGQLDITTVDGGGTGGHISLMPDGNVGVGTTTPTSHFQIDGNISASAWTTDGIAFDSNAATYTDTSTAAAGTVAVRTANSFGAPTLASTNAITVTDAFTLYVPKPIAGTNTTITRTNSAYFEGNVGVETTAPLAPLDIGGLFTPAALTSTEALLLLSKSSTGVTGLEFRNTNTGTAADSRFAVSDTTGHYMSFSMPSTGNTQGAVFGLARKTSVFLFNVGGTTRDMGIGTIDAKNLVLGTTNTARMTILSGGNVGIGDTTPDAKLHIDQSSTTAAIPTLTLDQADVSEEIIRIIGTSANAVLTQTIVEAADVGTATVAGYIEVYVQDDGNQLTDQSYYIPVYNLTAP